MSSVPFAVGSLPFMGDRAFLQAPVVGGVFPVVPVLGLLLRCPQLEAYTPFLLHLRLPSLSALAAAVQSGEREQEPHHSLIQCCLGISSTKQASRPLLNSTLPSPQDSLPEYSMHDGLGSRSRRSSRSPDTSRAGNLCILLMSAFLLLSWSLALH